MGQDSADAFAMELERRIVASLVEDTRSPEATRRLAAARALGDYGRFPESLSALHGLAESDPEVDVRYHARKSLGVIRQARTAAGAPEDSTITGGIPQAALWAALPAGELVRLLRNEQKPRCIAALISCLGDRGTDHDIVQLQPFLKHDNQRVVANAVEAIYKLGGESAIPILLPLAASSDNRVVGNVMLALVVFHPHQVMDGLRAMARSKQVAMRASALWCLGQMQEPAIEEILRQRLAHEPEPELLKRAAATLARNGTEASIAGVTLIAEADPGRAPHCAVVLEAIAKRHGIDEERLAQLTGAAREAHAAVVARERVEVARRQEALKREPYDAARTLRLMTEAEASWWGRVKLFAHRYRRRGALGVALCVGVVAMTAFMGRTRVEATVLVARATGPAPARKVAAPAQKLAVVQAGARLSVVGEIVQATPGRLVMRGERDIYAVCFESERATAGLPEGSWARANGLSRGRSAASGTIWIEGQSVAAAKRP